MRRMVRFIVLFALLMPATGWSAEWATLRGRIIYDGQPPVPKRVKVDKDVEVCGKYDLVDEVAHSEQGEWRSSRCHCPFLAWGRQEKPIIHPDYAKDASAEVLLENKCCRFEPHVTMMRTTQKLVIHNSDPKGDSVKIDPLKNNAINVTLPTGAKHVQEFPIAERVLSASAVRSIRGNWDG